MLFTSSARRMGIGLTAFASLVLPAEFRRSAAEETPAARSLQDLQCKFLIDSGMSSEAVSLVPKEHLKEYAALVESNEACAARLQFVARFAHHLGSENSWMGPRRWLEELEGVDEETGARLLSLDALRRNAEGGLCLT